MKTLIITAALTLSALFASAQTQHHSFKTIKVSCTLTRFNRVEFNKPQLDTMLKYNALGYKCAEVRSYNGVAYVKLYLTK